MRYGSGLGLIALGAILAFAVHGHPSFLNIQVVSWVLIFTGMAAMLMPKRGYGWLRRRMVVRRGPAGRPVVDRIDEQHYPPYVVLNPGNAIPGTTVPDEDPAVAVVADQPTIVDPSAGPVHVIHPDAERRAAERAAADWEAAERAVAEWEAADEATPPGEPRPAKAVVEEYVEEQ